MKKKMRKKTENARTNATCLTQEISRVVH